MKDSSTCAFLCTLDYLKVLRKFFENISPALPFKYSFNQVYTVPQALQQTLGIYPVDITGK